MSFTGRKLFGAFVTLISIINFDFDIYNQIFQKPDQII